MSESRRSSRARTRPPRATHRTLTSAREVGAYLHRTRLSILGALGDGPATVSQVAARLGVHPANLTRHVRILERAGLITLVEKRDTGRNLEKYYQASAHSFDVAPDQEALTAPHKIALAMARSELSAAMARLPDRSPGAVQVFSVGARLTPRRLRAFLAALARLAARFEGANRDTGEVYRLTLALFPGEAQDVRERPARRAFHKADRWATGRSARAGALARAARVLTRRKGPRAQTRSSARRGTPGARETSPARAREPTWRFNAASTWMTPTMCSRSRRMSPGSMRTPYARSARSTRATRGSPSSTSPSCGRTSGSATSPARTPSPNGAAC